MTKRRAVFSAKGLYTELFFFQNRVERECVDHTMHKFMLVIKGLVRFFVKQRRVIFLTSGSLFQILSWLGQAKLRWA